MVCGAAGIGKTSFIDLFMRKFNMKEANDFIRKRDHDVSKTYSNQSA